MIFNYKYMTSNNPLTNVYGLCRSFLALSLLITLTFNSVETLFDRTLFELYITRNPISSINLFYVLGDYDKIWLAKLLCIIILLFVIFGVYPRYTGILHWWVSYSFVNVVAIVEGGDQLNSILTLLLIPLTLLDDRNNHWKQGVVPLQWWKCVIVNSTMFLIQVQCCFVYLHASIEKLYKIDEWKEGVALYYFFKDALFGIPNWLYSVMKPIIETKFVFVLNWSVIIFELILFGALFMSEKNKTKLLIPAVVFHFLIAICFGLWSFFFSMCGLIVIYLLPPDFINNKINYGKTNI